MKQKVMAIALIATLTLSGCASATAASGTTQQQGASTAAEHAESRYEMPLSLEEFSELSIGEARAVIATFLPADKMGPVYTSDGHPIFNVTEEEMDAFTEGELAEFSKRVQETAGVFDRGEFGVVYMIGGTIGVQRTDTDITEGSPA